MKIILVSKCLVDIKQYAGGGALEWQEGVSGSSMDSQKAP